MVLNAIEVIEFVVVMHMNIMLSVVVHMNIMLSVVVHMNIMLFVVTIKRFFVTMNLFISVVVVVLVLMLLVVVSPSIFVPQRILKWT